MLESLAQEVADFEIKVTLIEPGPFATDFVSGSSMRQTRPIAAYDEIREKLLAAFTPDVFGDPQSTLGAVFKIVDADKPPFHGDKLPELARLQTALPSGYALVHIGCSGLAQPHHTLRHW